MRRSLRALLGPLLATVALLIAIEVGLRVAGFEAKIAFPGDPHANLVPLFHPATAEDGTAVWRRNDAPVVFRRDKPANGLRIFVVGESSVFGWPYGPDFAFPRFLHDRLAAARPDRTVEVVNAGVIAVGSWDVRRIVEEEIVHYEPDVVIVYSGHNDWWMPRRSEAGTLHRRLAELRLVQLAAKTAARWRQWRHGQFDLARLTRLDDAFGHARERARGERTLSRAEAGAIVGDFGENLRAIVRAAERAGATVVLGTLTQNLRDFPPGASRHRPGLDRRDRTRWRSLAETAEQEARAGDCRAALAALDRAFRVDRYPALGYYDRARCLDALGRYGRARAGYRVASDRDAVPMGTPSVLNEAIRAVARETGARVVEVPRALARASAHGLVGAGWFFDHLHPSFAGHVAIARAFAAALGAAGGTWPDPHALEAAHPELVKKTYTANFLLYLMLGWYDAADALADEQARRFPDVAAVPEATAKVHAAIATIRAAEPAPPRTDFPDADE